MFRVALVKQNQSKLSIHSEAKPGQVVMTILYFFVRQEIYQLTIAASYGPVSLF